MKVVVIGAGSQCFGRGQIVDLLMSEELQGFPLTLSLVDAHQPSLEVMAQLTERVNAHLGRGAVIESGADRARALDGANYVITAVARKRYELWEQDFRIPVSYGFRHCTGENGGPGALFHTLRSFELVIPICRDIEKYCPDALMLNFTNPEARVLHAILHLTNVKAAGLCHGVFAGLDMVSRCLQRPLEELEIISAGINHFYAILKVIDKETKKDLLGETVNSVLAQPRESVPALFRKFAEVFDTLIFPSDDHIGEYLSYASEFTGIKWHYGQESRPVPTKETKSAEPSIEDYASGKIPLDGRILHKSGESAVPILCDIELDRNSFRPAVNVLNRDLYIENLPDHSAIEVPAIVNKTGIHPLKVGPIPEVLATYIRTQCSIHQLLTEAYRTRSKKLLLQALLLDPLVNSVSGAEKMLDEMLELQQEFLPRFC